MGFVYKNTPITLRTGYIYEGNGKEIALHGLIGRSKKAPHHNTHWHPEETKIECATLWAVTRDIEKVHQIAKVPRHAIKRWMQEPWWDNVVSRVRKEQNELLDIKLTEVIGTAVEVISDRLKHGEVFVDRKTKEEYRVPVKVKNASLALEVTFKERQLVRGEATNRTESITQDQKLSQLKDQFEKLARSKQINPKSNPLEVEYESVQEAGEEATAGADSEDWPEEPSENDSRESAGDEEVNGEIEESRFQAGLRA
jgi:hypothetical protein